MKANGGGVDQKGGQIVRCVDKVSGGEGIERVKEDSTPSPQPSPLKGEGESGMFLFEFGVVGCTISVFVNLNYRRDEYEEVDDGVDGGGGGDGDYGVG
jgi:hypothetical protein